jgi:hypothetical protein
MLIGAALCIAGIGITAFTYSLVSESGGTYLILWGPAVYGAIRFFRGLVRLASSG